jgi:hypothetical protein
LLLKNNGFIITSDSFLGLTLLFLLVLISMLYVSQINFDYWNNINLIDSARDVSIVFDKGNFFEQAILEGSSELLLEKLNVTPGQLCFEISILPEDSEIPFMVASKYGCSKKNDGVSVVRSIVVEDDGFDFYLARVEAWYK